MCRLAAWKWSVACLCTMPRFEKHVKTLPNAQWCEPTHALHNLHSDVHNLVLHHFSHQNTSPCTSLSAAPCLCHAVFCTLFQPCEVLAVEW
jgi:hypothetical protein